MFVQEFHQSVPVVDEVEVLVVGGGPAGVGAALSAARNGASVILVDRHGFLGGNMTAALINPLFTFHDVTGRQVIRGIAEEIVQQVVQAGGAFGHVTDLTFDNASMTPFDPEVMKVVLFRMMEEAGVRLLLHSVQVGVIRENEKITHVIFETKSGPIAIGAKLVIDCTGDADVAYQAGVPTVKGRDEDGVMQPASTFFRIGGVDFARLRSWMKENSRLLKDSPTAAEIDGTEVIALLGLKEQVLKAMAENRYPQDAAPRILLYQLPGPGQLVVNASRLQRVDGTNVFDLTRAEVRGRYQAWEILEFLKKNIAGFENSYMLDTGEIGIRETRRIVGEYVLTEADVLASRRFFDGVACGAFAIDIHPPEGHDQVFTGSGKAVYEIPYRCLWSSQVTNLLVAGRCISANHIACGSIRVMATCIAMGQGAGTAAAMAKQCGWNVGRVDAEALRTRLIEQGQFLLDERCEVVIDPKLKLERTHSSGAAASHYNPFSQAE